jgi:predicted RNA polymerase sigma factor
VTLNHAVAVGMVDGPAAGLRMIDPLSQDKRLRRNHRLYAVRAHLLELDGQPEEARADYTTAARLTTSIPEQRYLIGQAERIVAIR